MSPLKLDARTLGQTSDPDLELLAEARALRDRLRRSAYRTTEGQVLWLKPGRPFDDEGRALALGPHLHAGSLGVALFLAAAGSVFDDPEDLALARETVAPLRRQLSQLTANPERLVSLQLKTGGVVGLGGFVYGLLRLGQWLEDPELVDEACAVANLFRPEVIEQDSALDLMYGSAGGILCLLRLDDAIGDEQRERCRPLDRAVDLGDHLLAKRQVVGDGLSGWHTFRPPSCGFGHGASGIAYALIELASRTGREDFREVAREGLAFERLHYRPEIGNWRSLRDDSTSVMNAWCNGAPGVALARLRIALHEPGAAGFEELEIALHTTGEAPPSNVDVVCCGDMGRAEILLHAGRQLGRTDLIEAAERIVRRVLDRAAASDGVYRCPHNDSERVNPTFFKGIAGIGYSLLRFCDADLPCVLALE